MKKKVLKIIAFAIAIALILGICWVANGLNGNPISKMLAKKAAEAGGTMCAVYNGANEAAVELFLSGKCKFLDITDLIAKAMDMCPIIQNPSLEDIYMADELARKIVKECC